MAITPKILYAQALITDTTQTLYTCPGTSFANCATVIDSCSVTNTSGLPVAINIYLTVGGDALANNYKIVSNRSILSHETYNCPEMVGQIIGGGDLIITTAGTTNVLTVAITGREIT